jgi:hypothetical protein
MFSYRSTLTVLPGLLSLLFASVSLSTEQKPYSPYADTAFPNNVYWGDTHIHTAYSVDAAILGRTRLMPDQAYRFARGEQVTATSGQPAKLSRPLDFVVLSDHAAYLGMMQNIHSSNPLLLASEAGKRWHDAIRAGGKQRNTAMMEMLMGLSQADKIGSTELRQSVWQKVIDNAEQFNSPGQFTAFIGYEWTSSTADGDNLHRNVIFRDGAERAGKVLPFSAQDSMDPQDLWAYLADYENNTGGKIMAIAHNGNLSNGRMFAATSYRGDPIDADYVKTRLRWEPVYEITQIKGDGEAHPILSPDDEFADFENWDQGNLAAQPKPDGALETEYGRSALKLGLAHEQELGTNPFKFGLIGSTDSHTGLATANEDNFWGKFSKYEPSNNRLNPAVLPKNPDYPDAQALPGWKSVASGYAAVWAAENTREALFDAMQRKEVYATTGPRMTVRFFGGFGFNPADAHRPDFAAYGYLHGVPMGGDLEGAQNKGRPPGFLISALKDPDGANLDRLQVIKGWLDDNGQLQERIYDVAVSGKRKIDKQGRARKPVGNTVDVADASYTNSIGTVQLTNYWQDPDFNPGHRAFYYVRVIEIPKPRWTAYDAKYYQLELDSEVQATVQDRAYTSPIWYTPQ